jgi:hypothetical protein
MDVILIIRDSVGLILGSMAAGILGCWMLLAVFKQFYYPEWGPLVVLVPAALAVTGHLRTSEFLVTTLIFASLAILPFWAEGIACRARNFGTPSGRDIDAARIAAFPESPLSSHRYPAVVGCICETRCAKSRELKIVATRILRKTFEVRHAKTGFAERRAALRAAKVALEGIAVAGATVRVEGPRCS